MFCWHGSDITVASSLVIWDSFFSWVLKLCSKFISFHCRWSWWFFTVIFAVLWSFIWTVTCGGVCLPVFTFDEDFLPFWYVLLHFYLLEMHTNTHLWNLPWTIIDREKLYSGSSLSFEAAIGNEDSPITYLTKIYSVIFSSNTLFTCNIKWAQP